MIAILDQFEVGEFTFLCEYYKGQKYVKIPLRKFNETLPETSHVILTEKQAKELGFGDPFEFQMGSRLDLVIEQVAEATRENPPDMDRMYLARAAEIKKVVYEEGYREENRAYAVFASFSFFGREPSGEYFGTPRYFLTIAIDQATFARLQNIDPEARFVLSIIKVDE